MKYRNSMRYYERLNRHYIRGLYDGLNYVNRPGLIYGAFRRQYDAGQKQAEILDRLTDKIRQK